MALRRFGVTADQAFFVDDVPANVAGAQAVGLTAIQFSGSAALRETLRGMAVL
jgi:FMN phosphatase YigB (HAD superfamily)